MTPGGNVSFVAVSVTASGNIISVAVYATGGGNIISAVTFNATVGGNIILWLLLTPIFQCQSSAGGI